MWCTTYVLSKLCEWYISVLNNNFMVICVKNFPLLKWKKNLMTHTPWSYRTWEATISFYLQHHYLDNFNFLDFRLHIEFNTIMRTTYLYKYSQVPNKCAANLTSHLNFSPHFFILLNPKRCGLLGGVFFWRNEVCLIKFSFKWRSKYYISYESWDFQLTFDTLINAFRFKA